MRLYSTHISPIADTLAYCLLRNHFHFLIRTKTEDEILHGSKARSFRKINPSQNFSNFFNAYSRTINENYHRTGSLFQRPFQRIPITSESHLIQLIYYIHFNPQKHGLIDDFKHWPWSSYPALISKGNTRLLRDEVINMFGSKEDFIHFHEGELNEEKILPFTAEE